MKLLSPPLPRSPFRPAALAGLRLRRLALAAACLLPVPLTAETAPGGAAAEPRQPVLATPWFRFHSDFDFNLYDAVLTSATARRRERPDPLHGACFAGLVPEERSAWDAAVGYYADTVAASGDFSRERFVVRTRLAGFAPELDDDDRRDLALSLLFLEAAARAYRACGWPDQDAANRRWIGELGARLERHGDAIGRRLEELYDDRWRSLPIAVDVVGTAGWSGADTIATRSVPTHTQISSRNPGYQGAAALEMIFHEASHELVTPHNGPVARLLATVAAEAGVGVDRNLWHGLLFVTVGEVTRSVLEAAGEGPYQPFAEANPVFSGPWEPLHAPLVAHWLPFVRGKSGREEAARKLVIAIGASSAAEESHPLHHDVECVLSEGLQIAKVRREHRSPRFRQGDYERIDCGASPREPPQQRGSPCQRFADLLHDVASLQEAVRQGVAARMPMQTLHEHDGRNEGRPEIFFAKRQDERCRLLRPLGQTGDPARIEDQHDGQPACRAGRRASRRATAAARVR